MFKYEMQMQEQHDAKLAVFLSTKFMARFTVSDDCLLKLHFARVTGKSEKRKKKELNSK